MKFSAIISASFAAATVNASGVIFSTGVATSCGQNTCCTPSCDLEWSDSKGCDGTAQTAGSCTNAWATNTSTQDTGVDICDGSGAFFCYTDGGVRVVYVVNRNNEVSAALFPAVYNECTLSGQCAPCQGQGSCQDAVYIGIEESHNCHNFDALLTSSNVDLQPC